MRSSAGPWGEQLHVLPMARPQSRRSLSVQTEWLPYSSPSYRYYYKREILERVDGRRLVYKFGKNARGWRENENWGCQHLGHKPKTHSKWIMINEELDVNISKTTFQWYLCTMKGQKKSTSDGKNEHYSWWKNYFVTLKYVLCGEQTYTVFCELWSCMWLWCAVASVVMFCFVFFFPTPRTTGPVALRFLSRGREKK